MIQALIFSKDRACQLDLLLRSIDKNFMHIVGKVHVLWRATNKDFELGYHQITQRFQNVTLWMEDDFKANTEHLLSMMEYVCFFVDDNIVYQPPNIYGTQVTWLMDNVVEAGCFSFRLGLNTTVQDPYSGAVINPGPNFQPVITNVLGWDWTAQPYNNFGYPFSVDGHTYNTKLILDTLKTYEFDTPNSLEGRFPAKRIPRGMFCMHTSSVVNNPINLVGSSNNKAGVFYGHSLESLNQAYLDGQQINLAKLCNENEIVGCHQEMKIEFLHKDDYE